MLSMRKVSIYVHAICNISNGNMHMKLFSLIRLISLYRMMHGKHELKEINDIQVRSNR